MSIMAHELRQGGNFGPFFLGFCTFSLPTAVQSLPQRMQEKVRSHHEVDYP